MASLNPIENPSCVNQKKGFKPATNNFPSSITSNTNKGVPSLFMEQQTRKADVHDIHT